LAGSKASFHQSCRPPSNCRQLPAPDRAEEHILARNFVARNATANAFGGKQPRSAVAARYSDSTKQSGQNRRPSQSRNNDRVSQSTVNRSISFASSLIIKGLRIFLIIERW
jgi:hypothetical protein